MNKNRVVYFRLKNFFFMKFICVGCYLVWGGCAHRHENKTWHLPGHVIDRSMYHTACALSEWQTGIVLAKSPQRILVQISRALCGVFLYFHFYHFLMSLARFCSAMLTVTMFHCVLGPLSVIAKHASNKHRNIFFSWKREMEMKILLAHGNR